MSGLINQEIVNDTTKLVMHRLIARQIGRDPVLIERARLSLAKIAVCFPERRFVRDGQEFLCLPAQKIRAMLTERNQRMTRLRLSSPFMLTDGVDFKDEMLWRRIRKVAKRVARRAAAKKEIMESCPEAVAP